jgi:cytochrome c-type biogenesis protein CcmH
VGARRRLAALALALLAPLAWAQAPAPKPVPAPLEDPALDKRVAGLAHELRCLVCQNQSLAESNAPLAVDLRNQIREQLVAGASEKDVREFMVARYGDFVLYNPPVKASTLALWAGPFVLLIAGVVLLWRRVARRRAPEAPLTEAERRRAAQLLE